MQTSTRNTDRVADCGDDMILANDTLFQHVFHLVQHTGVSICGCVKENHRYVRAPACPSRPSASSARGCPLPSPRRGQCRLRSLGRAASPEERPRSRLRVRLLRAADAPDPGSSKTADARRAHTGPGAARPRARASPLRGAFLCP